MIQWAKAFAANGKRKPMQNTWDAVKHVHSETRVELFRKSMAAATNKGAPVRGSLIDGTVRVFFSTVSSASVKLPTLNTVASGKGKKWHHPCKLCGYRLSDFLKFLKAHCFGILASADSLTGLSAIRVMLSHAPAVAESSCVKDPFQITQNIWRTCSVFGWLGEKKSSSAWVDAHGDSFVAAAKQDSIWWIVSRSGCNKVCRTIISSSIFEVLYFAVSLSAGLERTRSSVNRPVVDTWIVNSPAKKNKSIKNVVLLSQICLQVVWSRGVLAFFFSILKYKLDAFGLRHLRESERNTSAAQANHKRGVGGIKASASAVFQTCHSARPSFPLPSLATGWMK